MATSNYYYNWRKVKLSKKKLVMDFHYLLGNSSDDLYIKELAFAPSILLNATHFTFKPPFPENQLFNPKSIRANWFSEKMNGISWNFGEKNYLELKHIFDKLEQNYDIIYVKGNLKKKFLERYFKKCKIINMEDVISNMPSLKNMENPQIYCDFHKYLHNNKFCALNSVEKLLKFNI
jgi:hypothetical protein